MKRSNVSVFVPHIGCPNQCSFCNQLEITGCKNITTQQTVISAAETALNSKGYSKESEIAFFGGSFTGIEPEYMCSLLKAAHQYVSKGLFRGIRISTRPDYINQEVLNTLKRYGVTSIELGAQSMCDDVLNANSRGHSAGDVEAASGLILKNGFSLGLQMMTGLYKSNDEKDRYTAQRLAGLKPDTVRIYPALVLKNTELARLYLLNEYHPQTLESAVSLCADLLSFFEGIGIKVIRLGLHDSPSLKTDLLSGPYHPAFRELCESRIILKRILSEIESRDKKSDANNYTIEVNPRFVSKALGQKRSNIQKLKEHGINAQIVQNASLCGNEIKIIPIQ